MCMCMQLQRYGSLAAAVQAAGSHGVALLSHRRVSSFVCTSFQAARRVRPPCTCTHSQLAYKRVENGQTGMANKRERQKHASHLARQTCSPVPEPNLTVTKCYDLKIMLPSSRSLNVGTDGSETLQMIPGGQVLGAGSNRKSRGIRW